MAAAFNAYHKWLGIPPEEQPPHHYRLLGIKAFEADPDVIESAADQRMAHLRTLASGKNAELSQKLLNEISAAKVALLNPEKRAEYDQQLRRTIASASATSSPGATAGVAASAPVIGYDLGTGPNLAALPRINTQSRGRKRGVSPVVLFAALGGAIALVLIVGVLVAMNSGSGKGPDLAANPPTPPISNPPVAPAPPAVPSPAPPAPSPSPVVPRTTVEPTAVKPPPESDAWKDLAPGITLPRDAVRGTWTLDGGKLVTPKYGQPGNANALIKLATATPLPEAYDLRLVIERLDAAGYGVNVIVPIDGSQATVVLDGFRSIENGGGLWAIEQVDGRAGISNETKSPGAALAVGKQVEVLIEVRPDRITARGNAQRTEFRGSADRLSLHAIWKTNNEGLLLGAQGNFAFHRLEWRPATAAADAPSQQVVQRSVVTPLTTPLARAEGAPIDVLAKIDTKRDAVSGPWVFEEMALLRPGSGESGVLQVPVVPPAEYDLKVVVERHGNNGVGLGLVAGGKSFSLAFDADGQANTGLMLDGQWAWKTNDPTVFRGAVAPRGKEATIIANVRNNRLRVQVNDELVLDWAADYRRCSSFPGWEPREPNRLYLASNQSKFYVRKFELVPLAAGESVATSSPDATPLPSPRSTRPAPPDEAQQAEIRKALNEVHKLTAKRTPAEKRQLAGELKSLAEGARNKPAERYVFLRETQRLATEAGDFNLALQAVEGQADFEVDAMLESGRVLIAMAAAARDDFVYGKLVELVPEWVQRAMAEERVEAAEKLLEATLRAVQKPAGRKFAKPIIDLRTAVTARAKQARQLAAAREKLAADPNNPDANLAVGSVLCFHHGDWKGGLPLLAKGSDAALKACAERELAGPGKTADELIALGDAWWDAAAKARKDEQAGPTARAAHWYKLALGQSPSGLARIKIDRRLEEAAAAIASQPVESKLAPPPKASRVLIVMAMKNEQDAARQACQKYGLAFDEAKSFDRTIRDYSAYHTIICGSNDMNYWGKEEANKDPAAFQHIERFVNQGGHLVVCGTFNGANMEHLKRFGIHTGFIHASTFERAGPATDLLFQGVEDLVPADNRMTSAGHFNCFRQHVVLLKRGTVPGSSTSGGPALITRREEQGRLTFTQCEPHWRGDMWLISVLLNWVSRGAPTP